MPQYRAYLMNGDHTAGAPYVMIADDDEAAIAQARELVTSQYDVELWGLARLVIRIPRRAGAT